MLQSLSVRNYAIIESLEIQFSEKLSIITGETGAGKSILIGALSLILGQRADSNMLYDKDKKCIVEGHFYIKKYRLQPFFKQHDLDYEHISIIRREIAANGKSRAFINDTPVNLSILRGLSDKLVNLHEQHEILDLFSPQFQLNAIDSMAQNQLLLSNFQTKYRGYKDKLSQLEELIQKNQVLEKDMDYFQYQLKELKEINLIADEQIELEQELNTLNNIEGIKKALQFAIKVLEGDEEGMNNKLNEVCNELKSISKYDKDLEVLTNRLESNWIDLKDIAGSISHIEENTLFDEERIDEINSRLNWIYRLEKKHNCNSIEELFEVMHELEEKVSKINVDSDNIEKLEQELSSQMNELMELGKELSKNREIQIPEFENAINHQLNELGMNHARIKIFHDTLTSDKMNENGIDIIKFLFSSNKGNALIELKKVASGGELSRLMLCLKSLIAKTTSLPTLIFDEIDTGISGEIANRVGELIERLSENHQVFCITHRPQIASKGANHFHVYKQTTEDKSITKVKELNNKERIIEIAKMLSGENPTLKAVENAKDLLGVH